MRCALTSVAGCSASAPSARLRRLASSEGSWHVSMIACRDDTLKGDGTKANSRKLHDYLQVRRVLAYLELRGRDHQEHNSVLLNQPPGNVRILDVVCRRDHDATAHEKRQPHIHHAAVEDEWHGLEEHGSRRNVRCGGAVVVQQVHHAAMAHLHTLQGMLNSLITLLIPQRLSLHSTCDSRFE